jgi:hypothetical protein
MKRQATVHILVTALFVLLFSAACSSSGGDSQSTSFGDRGAATLPTVEAKELASLGKEFSLGESLDVDASLLPGPVGEPALSGNIKMQVDSTSRDVKIEEGTVPKLGAAYTGGYKEGQYNSKRGVFFAVNYTVTNETDGLLKPGAHISGSFTLADGTGREWKPMTFQGDHIDGSAAFALQQDLFDPREFVLQGEEKATTLGFDIPSDAKDLRLRSALLGLEVKLDY